MLAIVLRSKFSVKVMRHKRKFFLWKTLFSLV